MASLSALLPAVSGGGISFLQCFLLIIFMFFPPHSVPSYQKM